MKTIIEYLRCLVDIIHDMFNPLKVYDVYFVESLENFYEDPYCPAVWRRSGCYDIAIYAHNQFRLIVCARSEEQAVEYAVQEYMERTGDYDVLAVIKSDLTVPKEAYDGYPVDFISRMASDRDWQRKQTTPSLDLLKRNLAS